MQVEVQEDLVVEQEEEMGVDKEKVIVELLDNQRKDNYFKLINLLN